MKLDGIGPKSLAEVKRCIEALALSEVEEAAPAEEEVVAEAEVEVEAEPVLPAEPVPEAPVEAAEGALPEVVGEAEAPEAVEEQLRGLLERDDDYSNAGKPSCDWTTQRLARLSSTR